MSYAITPDPGKPSNTCDGAPMQETDECDMNET